MSLRTLLVWCPDWPVVAAELLEGVPARGPVAVLAAGRVIACSPAARAEGVVSGLRKREAQSRCPELAVLLHDPGRDTRAFEPVVAAVEQVAAGVAVLRPGACAVAARGPARYFGSEERAAERIVEQVAQECGVEARAGIADGAFAAELAARTGRIVPPGQTPEFLSGVDIGALGRPELISRLRRLGIHTLGGFAALPAGDVLTRFGFDAALAHRFAAGADERPLAVRHPPPDLAISKEYDEPLERVDVAAFAARALAQRLHERLAGYGLACTRLGIEAVDADGQERHRIWRHDGLLSSAAIADRVRWQLEGWLTSRIRPSAGIRRLRLVPDGVVAAGLLQPGLWGETGEADDRATRALTRVQGLLGPAAVLTAMLVGGRSYADRVRLVPWGEEPAADPPAPWPGRLPAPSPVTVPPEPPPATVQDAQGRPVDLTTQPAVSAPPAWLATGDTPPSEVVGWAGPWPLDERWWSPQPNARSGASAPAPRSHSGGGGGRAWQRHGQGARQAPADARQAARFQVVLADGRALLLALSGGVWIVEASYD